MKEYYRLVAFCAAAMEAWWPCCSILVVCVACAMAGVECLGSIGCGCLVFSFSFQWTTYPIFSCCHYCLMTPHEGLPRLVPGEEYKDSSP